MSDKNIKHGIDYLKKRKKNKKEIVKYQLKEGFTAQEENDNDNLIMNDLQTQYDRNLSNYAGQQQLLMDEINSFLRVGSKDSNDNNSIRNKSVQLNNGQGLIGYVTNSKLFKSWPSMSAMQSAASNPKCNINLKNIPTQYNESDGMYTLMTPNDGNINNTILLGSEMTPGPSGKYGCGNEGLNVYVDRPAPISNSYYYGTYYNPNPFNNNNFEIQNDMGSTSLEACKQRAADKGKSIVGMQNYNSTTNLGTCYIGSQLPSYTYAYKPIQLWGYSNWGVTYANLGADGALYLGSPSNNNIWNTTTQVSGCDRTYGGTINNINAYYGTNCNPANMLSFGDPTGQVSGTVTNGNYDPCWGTGKNAYVYYRCGTNWYGNYYNPPVYQGFRYGMNCSNQYNQCPYFYLQVLDNGNVTLTNGGNKQIIWQTNTSVPQGKQGAVPRPDLVAISAFGAGINTMWSGQNLNNGQYLVSPNGYCWLQVANGGLQLFYSVFDSTPDSSGNLIGNNQNSATIYMLSGLNNKNVGKMAHIDINGIMSPYPENMVSYANNYTELNNFFGTSNVLSKVRGDGTSKKCIDICNSTQGCAGFSKINGSPDCILHDNNVFPKGTRMLYNNSSLFLRNKKVSNSNTCSKVIANIDSGDYDNYPQSGNNMTQNTICGLGVITQQQKAKTAIADQNVNNSINNITDRMRYLITEKDNLANALDNNYDNIDKNVNEYDEIYKNISKITENNVIYDAIVDDSQLHLFVDNSKYITWSIISIIILIFTIRLTRNA